MVTPIIPMWLAPYELAWMDRKEFFVPCAAGPVNFMVSSTLDSEAAAYAQMPPQAHSQLPPYPPVGMPQPQSQQPQQAAAPAEQLLPTQQQPLPPQQPGAETKAVGEATLTSATPTPPPHMNGRDR